MVSFRADSGCGNLLGIVLQPDGLQQHLEWIEIIVNVQRISMRGKRHDPVHAVSNIPAESIPRQYRPFRVHLVQMVRSVQPHLPQRVDFRDVIPKTLVPPRTKYPVLQDQSINATFKPLGGILKSLERNPAITLNDTSMFRLNEFLDHPYSIPIAAGIDVLETLPEIRIIGR